MHSQWVLLSVCVSNTMCQTLKYASNSGHVNSHQIFRSLWLHRINAYDYAETAVAIIPNHILVLHQWYNILDLCLHQYELL